jgi:dTDP-4-dehydrorhamnose 3,5-epimerase
MKIDVTGFKDLLILEPKMLSDSRGCFMESYNRRTLVEAGIDLVFVQDNQSSSSRGVLRGLHFQNAPYSQAKLIRVLKGTILDVVVDLRIGQPTYGKHHSIELSAENNKQLLVPKGFAHGFVVLSDQAEVLYKCDEYYWPQADGGIIYNDPTFYINWGFKEEELILSEKDKSHPTLENAKFNF